MSIPVSNSLAVNLAVFKGKGVRLSVKDLNFRMVPDETIKEEIIFKFCNIAYIRIVLEFH